MKESRPFFSLVGECVSMIVYASMTMCVFLSIFMICVMYITYVCACRQRERGRKKESSVQKLQTWCLLSVRPKDWKGSLMLNTCQKQGPQVHKIVRFWKSDQPQVTCLIFCCEGRLMTSVAYLWTLEVEFTTEWSAKEQAGVQVQ